VRTLKGGVVQRRPIVSGVIVVTPPGPEHTTMNGHEKQ
jgi:hypothetical protein